MNALTRILGFALLSIPCAAAAAEHSAQDVMRSLSRLVGTWEGTQDGKTHRVRYALTANGTVLVETWTMSPTRESMTLYALDGKRLLATHFCPQGNQPRLAWTGTDADGTHRFAFVDGTGLDDPEGSHQQAFDLRIDAAGAFTRSETYVANTPGLDPPEVGAPVRYARVEADAGR